MSVATMQSQTKVESGQEPDILIVNEGSPLTPSPETGADASLAYDTDANFIAEWLRGVFCTMTLGRVARRLARHTGYLAEVDPHKRKADAWSTYAFILLGRPPEQRTEEDNLYLSRIIGAARALVSESARQKKEQPEERLRQEPEQPPLSAPEKEKCKPKAEQPSAPKSSWKDALKSLAGELRWGPKPLYEDDPEACLEYVRDKIEQLRPWRNALRGIVPSRPEFVDDPEACAQHIRERAKKLKRDAYEAGIARSRMEGWKSALEGMAPSECADNLTACRGYVENETNRLHRELRGLVERNTRIRVGIDAPDGMSITEYVGSLKVRISELEEKLGPKPKQPLPVKGEPVPSRLALNAARRIVEAVRSGVAPDSYRPDISIAAIIDEETMLPKWQTALEGLAPSGPEYVDNPIACAWYVQAKLAEIQDKLRRTTEEPTPEKEQCKTCGGRGWLLIGHYHKPSIERCGVCGVFLTDAVAVNHVAQLAFGATRIARKMGL